MHTIFVTPFHSSNVVLVHLPVSISALTLGFYNTWSNYYMRDAAHHVVCFPRVAPSTEEMHVGTKQ